MKRFYQTLIFSLCVFIAFLVKVNLIDFFSYLFKVNTSSQSLDFVKALTSCGIFFAAGYYYAKFFNSRPTIKKAALILFIINIVRLLFYVFRHNLFRNTLLIAYVSFSLLLSLIIYSFFLWLGGSMCPISKQSDSPELKTNKIRQSNPWLFGLGIFGVCVSMYMLLAGIESLFYKHLHNSPLMIFLFVSAFITTVIIPIFPGFFYAKKYNSELTMPDAKKAASVYLVIIFFIIPWMTLGLNTFLPKHNLNDPLRSEAEQLGYILGSFAGTLFIFFLCITLNAWILRAGSRIYMKRFRTTKDSTISPA